MYVQRTHNQQPVCIDSWRLLRDIELFCEERGISPSYLGKKIVNNGKFVARLREGGTATARTIRRFRSYMEEANSLTPKMASNRLSRPPNQNAGGCHIKSGTRG